MKAVIARGYGGPEVLEVQDIPTPTPKNNEILVKIHGSSVTRADTMMRTGKPYIGRLFLGLTKPKNTIPGTGFAGIIEAIGKDVTLFNIGQRIFGESVFGAGTNAQYLSIPEDKLILEIPKNFSYAQAAGICDGALTSMNFLKNLGDIKKGQSVLINGASGSLGTAAIQIAKHYGAKVTGVCSGDNMEIVKSLGADEVIDYKKEDFTKNTNNYDIVYDTVGKSSFTQSKTCLKEAGMYISPVLDFGLLLTMLWTTKFSTKKAKFSATGVLKIEELRVLFLELEKMMKQDELKTIIDKEYSLDDIVEAHSYVDKGHKKGNIVITSD